MTVTALADRASRRAELARVVVGYRTLTAERDEMLERTERAQRSAARNLKRARQQQQLVRSLRRQITVLSLECDEIDAERERLDNIIAGYETRTSGSDRNPMFRGRCYLCGARISRRALYCPEHRWAGDPNWGTTEAGNRASPGLPAAAARSVPQSQSGGGEQPESAPAATAPAVALTACGAVPSSQNVGNRSQAPLIPLRRAEPATSPVLRDPAGVPTTVTNTAATGTSLEATAPMAADERECTHEPTAA